jgi:epoxyqueuosine reductase
MDEKNPILKSIPLPEHLPGRDGTYDRELCNERMEKDTAESTHNNKGRQPPIKYCRNCEFACPVGKKTGHGHHTD